jgi:release factor glutamine methyltransferase
MILTAAATRLAAVSDTPRLDAELLLAHALGITREELLLGGPPEDAPGYESLLKRRLAGEPIAYITGMRDFWTITLAVTPAVLIPRPDSETLIEAAVDHFRDSAPASILDLGTGSGALLLAALDQWPGASGLGIDRSADALAVARGNAERLGMAERACFALGDWAEGIGDRFDLVLCNPPYVEHGAAAADVAAHEPHAALFAGADGLDAYRVLAPRFGRLIAPGGLVAIEIGAGQAAAVCALLAAEGLAGSIRRDLAGRDRCILIQG